MSIKPSGLRGVEVADSSICFIDGEKGVLRYYGYPIQELAEQSSFEESVYLLWNGNLPTKAELANFEGQLLEERSVPDYAWTIAEEISHRTLPMDSMRTLISGLSGADPDDGDDTIEASRRKASRLLAKTPTLVAGAYRIAQGKNPIPPDAGLNLAGNFLYMLTGEQPSATAIRALDVALILHAEHELNASTFAARVIAATLTDMYSAVTGAIGALKGPLHGGANAAALQMLKEIRTVDRVESEVQARLDRRDLIMGFGHAVYKTIDPRALVLKEMAAQLAEDNGDARLYELSVKVEEVVMDQKGLNPNVDFYSASVYSDLKIPVELFTPVFGISRMSGWAAHILEQISNNRIIRPRTNYVGKEQREYRSLSGR